MPKRLHHRKGFQPLPIKNGLNATRVRVPDDVSAIRAAEFLHEVIAKQRHRHPDDGEEALNQRFASGEVVLRDRTRLAADSMIKTGQDVYFYRIPAPETPVPFSIKIVYEDDNILVADKPPFLATMPRAQHITETATVRLRRKTGISDLTPAHRLDRMTSGLLLFTKRRELRGPYQTLFAKRHVHKEYEAIARWKAIGVPTRWQSRMTKKPGQLQGRIEDGQPNAVTDVIGIEKLTGQAATALQLAHRTDAEPGLYRLRPMTGKTHQLRLHMWQAGIPIFGDTIYPTILSQEDEDFAVPLQLKSVSLSFVDPLTNTLREFTAPGLGG